MLVFRGVVTDPFQNPSKSTTHVGRNLIIIPYMGRKGPKGITLFGDVDHCDMISPFLGEDDDRNVAVCSWAVGVKFRVEELVSIVSF